MELVDDEGEELAAPAGAAPGGTFAGVGGYSEAFAPLLLEECQAQVRRGWDEPCAPAQAAEVTRCGSEGWEGVSVGLEVAPLSRAAQGSAGPAPDGEFREQDLVGVSLPGGAGGRHAVLALVTAAEGSRVQLWSLKTDDVLEPEMSPEVGGRVSPEDSGSPSERQEWAAVLQVLQHPGGKVVLKRVCQMSTLFREWHALHSASSVAPALLRSILRAKPTDEQTKARHRGWPELSVPPPLQGVLDTSLNGQQLAGVALGVTRDPVVLIQGPPGTGKTHTLLNLLSVLSAARPTGGSSEPREPARFSPEEALATSKESGSPWVQRRTAEFGHGGGGFNVEQVTHHSLHRRDAFRPQRILVCAPSNSAVDEVLGRILDTGLLGSDGARFRPRVVRLAAKGVAVSPNVEEVRLENLVEKSISSTVAEYDSFTLARVRERRAARLVREASVVGCTLSLSGGGMLDRESSGTFDVVVIDEAAQAIEPATLVPLVATGARQVFLVGDPVQLPATVISKEAMQYGLDRSLFQRLQEQDFPVVTLKTQYRMHPSIRKFPGEEFYGGLLEDSYTVEAETSRDWHDYSCFGPFAFFNVSCGGEAQDAGSSLFNVAEADLAVGIYLELRSRFKAFSVPAQSQPSVGFVAPYRAQVAELRRRLSQRGVSVGDGVDVRTIDGFQGRECDIVIFSTVRSKPGGQIGFLSSERRTNVALTRARSSLIVLGNAAALEKKDVWGRLVKDAKKRDCFFTFSRGAQIPALFKQLTASKRKLKVVEEDWQPEAEEDVIERGDEGGELPKRRREAPRSRKDAGRGGRASKRRR